MNISPINNFTNNSHKSQVQANPSFGVNLMIEDRIPKFVIKEAANCAFKHGADPNFAINNGFAALVENASRLLEKTKDIEPKNLPVYLKLTPAAEKYVEDTKITGEMFNPLLDSVKLEVPAFGIGHVEERLKQFLPDAETMLRIEEKIKELAKLFT